MKYINGYIPPPEEYSNPEENSIREPEFRRAPEEFISSGGSPSRSGEFAQVPEEFPWEAPVRVAESPRRSRLKALLFSGVAVAAGWGLLGAAAASDIEVVAEPVAIVETVPSPAPTEMPVAAPIVTPAPTPSPSPVPTATPEPEKTEVEAIFVSFSDTMEGTVFLRGQQNILKAYVLVWDKQIQANYWDHNLTHEEIEEGVFRLPTLSTGDMYMEHMAEYDAINAWPDPELQVIYLFRDEDGSERDIQVIQPNSYELGFSTRYYEPDDADDWARPDCFVFKTYESPDMPVNVEYSQEDPTEPGNITVSLTINGSDVDPNSVIIENQQETYEYQGTSITYYYGTLVVPRPDWAGEHGVAHFTVREYLTGYDEIWVTERDVEY